MRLRIIPFSLPFSAKTAQFFRYKVAERLITKLDHMALRASVLLIAGRPAAAVCIMLSQSNGPGASREMDNDVKYYMIRQAAQHNLTNIYDLIVWPAEATAAAGGDQEISTRRMCSVRSLPQQY